MLLPYHPVLVLKIACNRPPAGAIPGCKGAHFQEAATEELAAAEGPPAGEAPLLPTAHCATSCMLFQLQAADHCCFCICQELTSLRILDIVGIEERPEKEPVLSHQQQEAA